MQLVHDRPVQAKSGRNAATGRHGNPIPTYDQTTIQNFAKVYTGWTYPTKPGATLQKHNPAYFVGPMVAYEPTTTPPARLC